MKPSKIYLHRLKTKSFVDRRPKPEPITVDELMKELEKDRREFYINIPLIKEKIKPKNRPQTEGGFIPD